MKWGKKFASPQELYHVIQTKHSIFIDNCRGLLWYESFSYKVLSWKQLNNSNTLRNFFNCQRSILTLYLITRCKYCIIKFRLSMIDYEIEIRFDKTYDKEKQTWYFIFLIHFQASLTSRTAWNHLSFTL